MKKIKLNFGLLAILFGGMIAVTQSAFKPAHIRRDDTQQWIFNGTTESQDKTVGEYTLVDANNPVPDNCDGESLPCYITVDGDLSTYLSTHTADFIRDHADATRD